MRSVPKEGYQEAARSSSTEIRRPASVRPNIRALKEGVRIETAAADYTELRLLASDRLLGRCVSPDHDDCMPSMTVYTATQTFKCYGIGCGAQGDVIDLVELAEGCETWEAMVHLGTRYGIELPGRPDSWHRRQERQRPVRGGIDAARILVARRRLYGRYFEPLILATVDPGDRARDAQVFWELTGPLAEHVVSRMMELQR
jgi:hypothetical protein